eukprot:ctg_534.g300
MKRDITLKSGGDRCRRGGSSGGRVSDPRRPGDGPDGYAGRRQDHLAEPNLAIAGARSAGGGFGERAGRDRHRLAVAGRGAAGGGRGGRGGDPPVQRVHLLHHQQLVGGGGEADRRGRSGAHRQHAARVRTGRPRVRGSRAVRGGRVPPAGTGIRHGGGTSAAGGGAGAGGQAECAHSAGQSRPRHSAAAVVGCARAEKGQQIGAACTRRRRGVCLFDRAIFSQRAPNPGRFRVGRLRVPRATTGAESLSTRLCVAPAAGGVPRQRSALVRRLSAAVCVPAVWSAFSGGTGRMARRPAAQVANGGHRPPTGPRTDHAHAAFLYPG